MGCGTWDVGCGVFVNVYSMLPLIIWLLEKVPLKRTYLSA